MDATLMAQKHWLVRETIGLLRRTFSRLDVSSRSLFALIEPGSCFAGSFPSWRWPATAATCWLPDDEPEAPKITVGETTSACSRWSPARAACSAASTTKRRHSTPCAPGRQAARRRRRLRRSAWSRPPGRHRLGRRDPHRHRGARRHVARRADRHGSQPALQRPGEHGHRIFGRLTAWQNWIFQRPNAVGERAR
jgi:benzoyl-CoA-dihydrodiol lyase